MFRCITSKIGSIFSRTYGSELEQYINSKSPKTLADVEYYAVQYERKTAHETFKF